MSSARRSDRLALTKSIESKEEKLELLTKEREMLTREIESDKAELSKAVSSGEVPQTIIEELPADSIASQDSQVVQKRVFKRICRSRLDSQSMERGRANGRGLRVKSRSTNPDVEEYETDERRGDQVDRGVKRKRKVTADKSSEDVLNRVYKKKKKVRKENVTYDIPQTDSVPPKASSVTRKKVVRKRRATPPVSRSGEQSVDGAEQSNEMGGEGTGYLEGEELVDGKARRSTRLRQRSADTPHNPTPSEELGEPVLPSAEPSTKRSRELDDRLDSFYEEASSLSPRQVSGDGQLGAMSSVEHFVPPPPPPLGIDSEHSDDFNMGKRGRGGRTASKRSRPSSVRTGPDPKRIIKQADEGINERPEEELIIDPPNFPLLPFFPPVWEPPRLAGRDLHIASKRPAPPQRKSAAEPPSKVSVADSKVKSVEAVGVPDCDKEVLEAISDIYFEAQGERLFGRQVDPYKLQLYKWIFAKGILPTAVEPPSLPEWLKLKSLSLEASHQKIVDRSSRFKIRTRSLEGSDQLHLDPDRPPNVPRPVIKPERMPGMSSTPNSFGEQFGTELLRVDKSEFKKVVNIGTGAYGSVELVYRRTPWAPIRGGGRISAWLGQFHNDPMLDVFARDGEVPPVRYYAAKNFLQSYDRDGLTKGTLREVQLGQEVAGLPHIVSTEATYSHICVPVVVDSKDDKRGARQIRTVVPSPAVGMLMAYHPIDLNRAWKKKQKQDVDKIGAFGCDEVRMIMRQLLVGLDGLHKQGIFHRDLKQGNIVLTSEGKVELLDFGLARRVRDNSNLTNNVVTMWYRAPELLLGGRKYTQKIDIWSLGIIMMELLSNENLTQGSTELAVLLRIFDTIPLPTKNEWFDLTQRTPMLGNRYFWDILGPKVEANLRTFNITDEWEESTRENFRPWVPIIGARIVAGHVGCSAAGVRVWKAIRGRLMKEELLKWNDLNKSSALELGVDFILRMVHWDEKQRWSAERLLAHPWITCGKEANGVRVFNMAEIPAR